MSIDLGSAHAKLTLDAKGLTQGAQQAHKSLESLQRTAAGVFAGLGIGAAVGFGAVVKTAFDMNATLETTQLQFETLMGSADKAQRHVASLFEIAKKTPFETGPIIEASRYLQTFGGDALNTKDNILLIGDAAAATNAPIEDLGFWVGRLYANLQAGQPFGEAAMRLQELGVLGPQIVNDLREMQASGASADEMFAALTANLGRFGGAMERQAGTWRGMVSTFLDTLKMTAAEGLAPLFEGAKDALQQVIVLFNDPAFIESVREFATQLGEMTAKVLPLVVKHFPALAKLLGLLVAGFGALSVTTKVVGIFSTLAPVVAKVAGLMGLASTATTAAGAAAAGAAGGTGLLGGALTALTGPIGWVIGAIGLLAVAWAKDWGGIREKTAAAIDFVRGYVEQGIAFLRALWDRHGAGIVCVVSELWAAVKRYFQMGIDNARDIIAWFGALLRGDWEEMGRLTREIWTQTLDALRDIFEHLWEAVRPALESFARQLVEWWQGIDWAALGKYAADQIVAGVTGAKIGERIDPAEMIKRQMVRSNPFLIVIGKALEIGPKMFHAGQEIGAAWVDGWQAEVAAEELAADMAAFGFSPEAARETERAAAASAERVAAANRRAQQEAAAGWRSASQQLLGVTQGYDRAASAAERMGRATSAALTLQSANTKLAHDRALKFAGGIDALTAAAGRNQAAMDAAKAATERYAAAFGAVQGDYTRQLPGADEPLVTPERTVNVVTQVSGPTEEQAALVERYSDELDRLRERYTELTGGIGTFGMEQDKVNEAIANVAGEIAHYEGLLAGIPPTVESVSSAHQGLKVNVDAVHQGIYDQLVQMGAAPEVITAYAVATGIMSEAQAEAALQAAAVKSKIEDLGTAIAGGMPIEAALADLDAFIKKIETGVTPATESLKTTVPQDVTDMGLAMWDEAITAGEGVPGGVAQGINDNLESATTAATDAATAVIDATRARFGAESPSTEFAAIGGDLIAGLVEGAEGAEGEATGAMEGIGDAVIDAWDGTIAAADDIGRAIIDGVVAGAEANRGKLVAKMEEIAMEAYERAMQKIDAKSPSRLFMNMGQAIIDGVIAGLNEEEDALYDKLTAIADKLYQIGQGMFDFRADKLADDLDTVGGAYRQLLDEMRRYYGDTAIDNILDMPEEQQAFFLRLLRGNPAYGTPWGQMQLDEAIRLADERNRLNEEYARQQEELLKLEEQRARLNFLQMQVDLLNLIRENNLSTDILDGLRLGLDANISDVIAAMTEAVRQLIERANEELEIASPSAVFTRIGQQVMSGLGEGLSQTRDVERRMRAAMGRMSALGVADAGRLESRLSAGLNRTLKLDASGLNPAQTVYIYGGYNPALAGAQTAADPLRDLYWRSR